MSDKEKDKAVELAIAAIEKQFGKGSIMAYGSGALPDVEFLSSGSISLDKALGGGYGRGRVIEIYGPESSGKTSLTLHAIAECQKNGGIAAFVDAEHALDPAYATSLAVDMDQLLISQPGSAEEGLQIAIMLAESGGVDLIVVDSVAALVPKAELEGDVGDSHMGLQARLMGQTLRKLSGVASKSNTTVIFINQLRMKIGVMFGNPETTTGGGALKFYASQRLDIRTTGKEKIDEEITGIFTRVKVVKNKLAPAFKEAAFSLEFGKGINKYLDLLTYASNINVIEKAGSWYSYKGKQIGQGASLVMDWLKEHQDIYEEIFNTCKAM